MYIKYNREFVDIKLISTNYLIPEIVESERNKMFSTFLAKIIVPAKNGSENNHVVANSN